MTERQISSYFLAVYYLNGETASLTVCPNGKQKCPMVSSVPIDDLSFTQKKANYLPKGDSFNRIMFQHGGEELQMVISTLSVGNSVENYELPSRRSVYFKNFPFA